MGKPMTSPEPPTEELRRGTCHAQPTFEHFELVSCLNWEPAPSPEPRERSRASDSDC